MRSEISRHVWQALVALILLPGIAVAVQFDASPNGGSVHGDGAGISGIQANWDSPLNAYSCSSGGGQCSVWIGSDPNGECVVLGEGTFMSAGQARLNVAGSWGAWTGISDSFACSAGGGKGEIDPE